MHAKPGWLEALFPWPQHGLIVNGRRMAFIDEGPRDGVAVLLLSGNPTWGFLYRDFIRPLAAAGFRAIAPDWIGAGYSDHPQIDAGFTLAHHVADLVSLIDQLALRRFVIVGQDWGGPQGVGAALQRIERLDALVLMNTWLFTDVLARFHADPTPWTTWHAPLLGPLFLHRLKALSHDGPTFTTQRGMTADEARGYHHVFDAAWSDRVTLTWPRTIPMVEGDRGWADMTAIHDRLGELANVPTQLIWAPGDMVFPIAYAERLKALLPHAEGPIEFDRAAHFLQDDRGAEIAPALVAFLARTVGAAP